MSVESKVKEIIAEQLGISDDEITLDSSFVEDLGADSLDIVEVVMAVEEEFEIEMPECDAEQLETVQDLVEYIGTRAQ